MVSSNLEDLGALLSPFEEEDDSPSTNNSPSANNSQNDADVPVVTELTQIAAILKWFGFEKEEQCKLLIEEAFQSFDYLKQLTEKDIHTLNTSFSERTKDSGRMIFGLRKTKRLLAFVHWVQDFNRISLEPSILSLEKEAFLAQLNIATERAAVRKILETQSDSKSKAASPGPLISEAVWKDWEPKFKNYLSCILGVTGVPLL